MSDSFDFMKETKNMNSSFDSFKNSEIDLTNLYNKNDKI